MTHPVQKTDAEWRTLLAAKNAEAPAFDVTRRAATERPFTGKYEQHWATGCSTTAPRRTATAASWAAASSARTPAT